MQFSFLCPTFETLISEVWLCPDTVEVNGSSFVEFKASDFKSHKEDNTIIQPLSELLILLDCTDGGADASCYGVIGGIPSAQVGSKTPYPVALRGL